jgi:para-nitrobenzyl esterase
VTLAQKEQEGVAAMRSIGLSPDASVADLRKLSVEQLNKAIETTPLLAFGPFVDGRIVTLSPADSFRQGKALDVPLIIGWNSNEASLIEATGAPPATMLAAFKPEELTAMRQIYGARGTPDEALARAVFTDFSFGAPARWIAARAHSGAPSFLYHFDYTVEMRRGEGGANHGAEIPYVFATVDAVPALRGFISARDRAMAKAMSACWVAFAAHGKPACEGAPVWPAYDPQRDELLKFGAPTELARGFHKEALDYQEASLERRLRAAR